MGWAYFGIDSRGRNIGYGIPAICDHLGCETKIDRGLAYCCGAGHGGQGYYDENLEVWLGCGGYFCSEHLSSLGNLCPECITDHERLEAETHRDRAQRQAG